MSFEKLLQAFLDDIGRRGERFTPSDMLNAYTTQIAGCVAVATDATGEEPKPLLDAIDKTVRLKTEKCIRIQKRRRN